MKKVEVKIYIDRYGYEHLVIDEMDFQVRYKKWGRKALAYVFEKLRERIKEQRGWSRMHWKEFEYEHEIEIDDEELKKMLKESGTRFYKMIERKLKRR